MRVMQSYRHLNLLVCSKTYEALKDLSYNLNKPVSEIVRQGIALVLSNPEIKPGADISKDN